MRRQYGTQNLNDLQQARDRQRGIEEDIDPTLAPPQPGWMSASALIAMQEADAHARQQYRANHNHYYETRGIGQHFVVDDGWLERAFDTDIGTVNMNTMRDMWSESIVEILFGKDNPFKEKPADYDLFEED